ncbi:MAG: flippase [Candidatus Marinimicrobia bacterium]|nr:flippase [Candidatus Neomarinimicrobiota bacterium]
MNGDIKKSIAKNTGVMMIAQMITWVSSFVLLMFLPRYLGSVEYGRLHLALSIAMILRIIIDFGGNHLIPKEVAKSRERLPDVLMSFIGVRSGIWLAVLGGIALFTLIAGYSGYVRLLILIMAFSTLWQGLQKALRGCFQGCEMMEYPSIGNVAEKVFLTSLAVAALLLGANALTIVIVMTTAAIVNFLVCVKFAPKILDHLPAFNVATSVNMVRQSLPYFLWSVSSVIYYRVDTVMLSLMTPEQVIGWYGASYKFFDVVMFLPTILTTVLFPILSKLWVDGEDKLLETLRPSLKYIILAGIPVSILFFGYAEQIIDLFYGIEEYRSSVIVLQVFAPGIVLVYIDFILGNTILATDKQVPWAAVGGIAIVLNVVLNLFLIPHFQNTMGNGGVGAAITTLITEALVMVAAFFVLPRSYGKVFPLPETIRVLGAGSVMLAVVWWLHSIGVFWIFGAIISGIVYAGMVFAFRILGVREKELLSRYLSIGHLKSLVSEKGSAI